MKTNEFRSCFAYSQSSARKSNMPCKKYDATVSPQWTLDDKNTIGFCSMFSCDAVTVTISHVLSSKVLHSSDLVKCTLFYLIYSSNLSSDNLMSLRVYG